jgi:hypothetical protein
MSSDKKRARRTPPTAPRREEPAASPPPRAAEPPPVYEEPGARNPDRHRVEGMSIDPKLEDLPSSKLDDSAGAPTRPRRE